jgi:hypothetical protein
MNHHHGKERSPICLRPGKGAGGLSAEGTTNDALTTFRATQDRFLFFEVGTALNTIFHIFLIFLLNTELPIKYFSQFSFSVFEPVRPGSNPGTSFYLPFLVFCDRSSG